VEHGAACVPLLIGVLRGWARGVEGQGGPSAAAAVTLLGEIGDKAAIPAIRECRNAGDRDVKVCAIWAAQRMQKLPGGDHVVYSVCCQPLIEAEPAGEPPDRQSGIVQESRISGWFWNSWSPNASLAGPREPLRRSSDPARRPDLVTTGRSV